MAPDLSPFPYGTLARCRAGFFRRDSRPGAALFCFEKARLTKTYLVLDTFRPLMLHLVTLQ